MASPDRLRTEEKISMGERRDGEGLVANSDPAGSAAHVVAEEVLSILQAVEARTSEIDATARRDAEAIRRAADRAGAHAVSRFAAITRELDALAAELEDRAARRADER
jgi:hypothetical protein